MLQNVIANSAKCFKCWNVLPSQFMSFTNECMHVNVKLDEDAMNELK